MMMMVAAAAAVSATVSMAVTTVGLRAVTMTEVAELVTEEMAVVAGSSDGQPASVAAPMVGAKANP